MKRLSLRSTKIPIYLYSPLNKYGDGFQYLIPLPFGLIIESARIWDSGALTEDYDLEVPLVDSEVGLIEAIELRGPGVVLFSDYVWSIVENTAVSAAVKARFPSCLTIHGGPSVPKYEDIAAQWMRDHPHVDVAVRGEGEITAAEVLANLRDYFRRAPNQTDQTNQTTPTSADLAPLSNVLGQTYAWTDEDNGERKVHRTEERPRLKDPGSIPSPFLSGFFEGQNDRPWSLGLIETNRGCPYGCTYCDWGSATLQKINQYSVERVRAEVMWHGRRQIPMIFLADANFGILPRDIEIARAFADAKRECGFPIGVLANYAKNGTLRLGEIFNLWEEAGLAFDAGISIQTIDKQVLEDVRRANIKTEKYEELSDLFDARRLPTVIQVMVALPGSTVESTCRDIEHFFLRDQESHVFLTQMLPNAPMADPTYMKEYKIGTRNNFVVSSYSFTEAEWRTMARITATYRIVGAWRVLAHYLRWLHLDEGIAPITVYLRRLVSDLESAGLAGFPSIEALLGPLVSQSLPIERAHVQTPSQLASFIETGWTPLLEEFEQYSSDRFGVRRSQAATSVMMAMDAVLPRLGRKYPFVVELPHDVASFLRDNRRTGAGRKGALSTYDPAVLTVEDPANHSNTPPHEWMPVLSNPNPEFELLSNLRDTSVRVKKKIFASGEELRKAPRALPVLR